MKYNVYTKYDDGFISEKDFEDLKEAKNYFHNVDVNEIVLCSLCEETEVRTQLMHKEGRKKS